MHDRVRIARLDQRLAQTGFRFTPQRRHVFAVLLRKRDHPTAEQVFIRAKQGMPNISIATVYNCLDTLVKCGLVRAVNLEHAARRYCPNMRDHLHFFCEHCGRVFDIALKVNGPPAGLPLPPGFRPQRYEVSIRGACPACGPLRSSGSRRPKTG